MRLSIADYWHDGIAVPKFGHLYVTERIQRQTVVQIIGPEFEEKLRSAACICSAWSTPTGL